MSYHYTDSGLDNIWLEDGYTVEEHPNYGQLISVKNVRGLHEAIGRWLVGQPRTLNGAEFRFLRLELDLSQKSLGVILGVTEQAVAKWEKAKDKAVANRSAERLLRLAYINYLDGKPEFSAVIDRITQLDAEIAEHELRLTREQNGWHKIAA
ncbi:helix-turn-helix domain-containing protein [Sinorhizobium americanum]|nr:helix-turn-helix domain-containing protein [Sinorhizobium americanum]